MSVVTKDRVTLKDTPAGFEAVSEAHRRQLHSTRRMTTITAFIRRHPVSAYFGLTFVLSWGGMLLAIGSAGGMRGTTPASDPRFAYALTMLAGPSLTGQLLTALVHGGTGLRECARHLLCPTPPRSLESAQVAVQPHV